MTKKDNKAWIPLICAVLFFVVLLLLYPKANATTYYVREAGNDGSAGTSWATAWATVNKVNTTIAKGDSVFFGEGTYYGYSILPPVGTGTAWTVYTCSTNTVETQHDPKIRSGDLITGWTQHSGNVYKAYWNASGGYSGNECQTMVQVEADEMLACVTSITNINNEGEFWYKLSVDSLYAWAWGGGDPDGYTLYASVKPVVYFYAGSQYRSIKFFGLDLQGGKQGVVLWTAPSSVNTNNVRFEHCHVAKSGYLNHENPACFFGEADYGNIRYDSVFIVACSLGYAIHQNAGGWDDATGHGGATDFYSFSNTVVESCYVYGYSANGIAFKYTNEGITIRYNFIDGTNNKKGITLYRDYADAEIYGNILDGRFSQVAMDIGAKDIGDTYGAHNVKIYNNTIVNFQELGIMFGNYDWESPVIFTGDNQVKYNVLYAYTRDGTDDEYNSGWIMSYHPSYCTACEDDITIDSNAYYSSTDNFEGACNGYNDYTFTQWQSNCGEDANGVANVALGLNMSTYALPDTTSLTMDTTYGGRAWTVYGAVQPTAEEETVKTKIKGFKK